MRQILIKGNVAAFQHVAKDGTPYTQLILIDTEAETTVVSKMDKRKIVYDTDGKTNWKDVPAKYKRATGDPALQIFGHDLTKPTVDLREEDKPAVVSKVIK